MKKHNNKLRHYQGSRHPDSRRRLSLCRHDPWAIEITKLRLYE